MKITEDQGHTGRQQQRTSCAGGAPEILYGRGLCWGRGLEAEAKGEVATANNRGSLVGRSSAVVGQHGGRSERLARALSASSSVN